MRKRITLTAEAILALDDLRTIGVRTQVFIHNMLPNIAPPCQVRVAQASRRRQPSERIRRDSELIIERAGELRAFYHSLRPSSWSFFHKETPTTPI